MDEEGRYRKGDTCRFDNSLGLLTSKFLVLLQNAESQCVDLNEVSKVMAR